MSNIISDKLDMKQHIDCSDIYMDVITKHKKSLWRMMEAWSQLDSESESKRFDYELFQYADLGFHYYRSFISACERDTRSFLTDILFRIMRRYSLNFLIPESGKNRPFEFILIHNGNTTGFRFDDFTLDEDVDVIIRTYEVNSIIIRTWKSGITDKWIERENRSYRKNGIKCCKQLRKVL